MLKTSLEEKGHSVVLAFDGLAGLSYAETDRFDVMVLDIMLPGIDGLEVIRRLRKQKHLVPVARKGPSVQEIRLKVADLVLDPASGRVSRLGTPLSLTRTQFALLEYFMRRAGHVLTREAIIERIWSDNPDIESNTLEVFIRSLRSKIDVDRTESLIKTVRGVGYRMEAGVSS